MALRCGVFPIFREFEWSYSHDLVFLGTSLLPLPWMGSSQKIWEGLTAVTFPRQTSWSIPETKGNSGVVEVEHSLGHFFPQKFDRTTFSAWLNIQNVIHKSANIKEASLRTKNKYRLEKSQENHEKMEPDLNYTWSSILKLIFLITWPNKLLLLFMNYVYYHLQ